MGIAETAIAALQEDEPVAGFGEIGENFLAIFIQNLGAGRHFQDDILAARAGAPLPHAVGAALRLEVLFVAEVDQRVQIVDALENHVAAAPAVTAVWPAILDELLAPKADAARAAVTAFEENFRFVEEAHGFGAFLRRAAPAVRSRGRRLALAQSSPAAAASAPAGTTLT